MFYGDLLKRYAFSKWYNCYSALILSLMSKHHWRLKTITISRPYSKAVKAVCTLHLAKSNSVSCILCTHFESSLYHTQKHARVREREQERNKIHTFLLLLSSSFPLSSPFFLCLYLYPYKIYIDLCPCLFMCMPLLCLWLFISFFFHFKNSNPGLERTVNLRALQFMNSWLFCSIVLYSLIIDAHEESSKPSAYPYWLA